MNKDKMNRTRMTAGSLRRALRGAPPDAFLNFCIPNGEIFEGIDVKSSGWSNTPRGEAVEVFIDLTICQRPYHSQPIRGLLIGYRNRFRHWLVQLGLRQPQVRSA